MRGKPPSWEIQQMKLNHAINCMSKRDELILFSTWCKSGGIKTLPLGLLYTIILRGTDGLFFMEVRKVIKFAWRFLHIYNI